MEAKPDNATDRPATPRHTLKRVAWTVALMAGVVLLGDIGVIVYNLLRPVAEPAIIRRRAMVSPTSGSKTGQSSVTTGTLVNVAPSRSDEPTSAALERPIPELIPLASLSQPEQVEKARVINAQYAGCVRALRDYLAKKDRLDYETAKKMLHAVDGPPGKIDEALRRDFNELSQRAPYHDGEWFGQMYRAEGVDQGGLYLDLAVRHERWFDAAVMSRSWDEEVYYLRKAGPRGRTLIAMISNARVYNALKDSLLSIGPDFHLPKMTEDRRGRW